MKFTIERASFLDALQKVQNVVPARSTLQILSNALLVAEDGGLTLTTTDLDISVRCKVEAVVEEAGATTLPIRRLVSIVRELSDAAIEVAVDDTDTATVQCGSSYFKIVGLPRRDFPPVPEADGTVFFRIDSGVFREMLRKTSYAVSTDETRRVLTGVLLAFRDGKLTTVATDGRRLALVEHEIEFPPETDPVFLLHFQKSCIRHLLCSFSLLDFTITEKEPLFNRLPQNLSIKPCAALRTDTSKRYRSS